MVVGQKFEMEIPEITILKGKISITPLCQLTEAEENAFAHAIIALEKQLKYENMTDLPKANIIFTLEDGITLKLDTHVLGNYVPGLIIYPIKKWRDKNMQGNSLIVIMLEELCHCFWQEYDEVKVKHIVMKVLRNISVFKELNINDVYNRIYDIYNNPS